MEVRMYSLIDTALTAVGKYRLFDLFPTPSQPWRLYQRDSWWTNTHRCIDSHDFSHESKTKDEVEYTNLLRDRSVRQDCRQDVYHVGNIKNNKYQQRIHT